jgi:hypothetical protein
MSSVFPGCYNSIVVVAAVVVAAVVDIDVTIDI